MIKVYADKIFYKKINEKTGYAWCLADVPEKYRNSVEEELAKRG